MNSLRLTRNCLRTQVVRGKRKTCKEQVGKGGLPRCSPIDKLETSGGKPPFPTCSMLSFIFLICCILNKQQRTQRRRREDRLTFSLSHLLDVPFLIVLRQCKYTGRPSAIKASPIADCFGVFLIVVKISHVQIAMNRTGTTG